VFVRLIAQEMLWSGAPIVEEERFSSSGEEVLELQEERHYVISVIATRQ
jgi:hypothetical protein